MPPWVEILLGVLAAAATLVGVWLGVQEWRRKKAEANRHRDAELSRLISATAEVRERVGILDVWIWEKRMFTRKQGILEALEHLCHYCKENDEPLRRLLGADSPPYKSLRSYFGASLKNQGRHDLPGGSGDWIGIDNTHMGLTLDRLFMEIRTTLEQIRNGNRR